MRHALLTNIHVYDLYLCMFITILRLLNLLMKNWIHTIWQGWYPRYPTLVIFTRQISERYILKLFPNFAKVTCHCSHESDQAHKPHRLLCWEPFALTTLTHFIPLMSFYTPWKQKIRGSLMFSEAVERDQWHEMGW